MPGKNILKPYVESGHYHIYNRGVEKRPTFLDDQDYKVYLSFLKEYLSPPDPQPITFTISTKNQTHIGIPHSRSNYFGNIKLICYVLMPNHFHFLVKQTTKTAITNFMRSLTTRYSIYFNKRYHRVGNLFQSRYKAVLIDNDNYLLHLSRYIHLNPTEITNNLITAYSSYADFLDLRHTNWIDPQPILECFSQPNDLLSLHYTSYQEFVESSLEAQLPDDLLIESLHPD